MIDFHCHTTASDGLMTPRDLIRRAKKEGIKVLSIADQDTVDGLIEVMPLADNKICLIPAIELSVAFPRGDFHLLGYGIDYTNQDFRFELERLRSIREERLHRIVKRLNEVGISLALKDVEDEAQGAVPGKPHVARALVKKGHAADVASAIEDLLNEGKPGHVPKEKISAEVALRLIRNAGGTPVLAHPKSLACENLETYERIIESYIPHGLVGIEVFATIHDDGDVEIFNDIAQRHNLIATGGSDFHGEDGERLGYYGKGRTIPINCAQSLFRFIDVK